MVWCSLLLLLLSKRSPCCHQQLGLQQGNVVNEERQEDWRGGWKEMRGVGGRR